MVPMTDTNVLRRARRYRAAMVKAKSTATVYPFPAAAPSRLPQRARGCMLPDPHASSDPRCSDPPIAAGAATPCTCPRPPSSPTLARVWCASSTRRARAQPQRHAGARGAARARTRHVCAHRDHRQRPRRLPGPQRGDHRERRRPALSADRAHVGCDVSGPRRRGWWRRGPSRRDRRRAGHRSVERRSPLPRQQGTRAITVDLVRADTCDTASTATVERTAQLPSPGGTAQFSGLLEGVAYTLRATATGVGRAVLADACAGPFRIRAGERRPVDLRFTDRAAVPGDGV